MESEWEKERRLFNETDKWLRDRGIVGHRKGSKDSAPRPWVCPKCQKFEGTLEEVQEHQSHCDPSKEDEKENKKDEGENQTGSVQP